MTTFLLYPVYRTIRIVLTQYWNIFSGSIVTLADLRDYRSVLKEPLAVSLNNGNYKVYSPTAPSSGVVLSFILNILDGRMLCR